MEEIAEQMQRSKDCSSARINFGKRDILSYSLTFLPHSYYNILV